MKRKVYTRDYVHTLLTPQKYPSWLLVTGGHGLSGTDDLMLSGFWRKPPIFSLIVVRSGVNCPSSPPADFNRRFILPCPLSGLLLRWSLFAAGRGQDVNSFTACGNPTISLAAPVKKGSGTLPLFSLSSAPPSLSPLRSLSSCSSTPAEFWLHCTRARRECMHSKFQFYHMERT